jgi:hypothetical protein
VVLGALAVTAWGATACGSSAPSPVAARALSAHGRALASESLIRLSDFPVGWTAKGRVTEGNGSSGLSKAQDEHLVSCIKVPASDIDTHIPHWTSPTFSDSSNAASVDDDVTVYPTAAKAKADYSTFSNERTPECLVSLLGRPLEAEIAKQLQPGETVGKVTAERRHLPSFGKHSGDIELVIPIVEGTRQVPVYVDVIVVLEGRSESTLTASSPGTAVSPALVGQLTRAAASRMRPISA